MLNGPPVREPGSLGVVAWDGVVGAVVESGLLHPAEHVQGRGGPRVALPPVHISWAVCMDHGPPLKESLVIGSAEVKGGSLAGSIRAGKPSRMACSRDGDTLPPVSSAQARPPGVQGCPLLHDSVLPSLAVLL